jgi:hypothetical protein
LQQEQGMRLAGPAGGQVRVHQDAQAGIALRQFVQSEGRLIGGTVVQNDEFVIWVGLGEQGLHTAADVTRFVPRRDDDRNQWRFERWRGGRNHYVEMILVMNPGDDENTQHERQGGNKQK